MATLASVALSCAKQLGRANAAGTAIVDLEAEIKEEIAEAIKFYNRRPNHLTEFRGFEVTTASSTTWYSTIDLTNGDGDQDSTGRTAVNANTILTIDYARENPGGSGNNEPLSKVSYQSFEGFFEGATSSGSPTYFTYYAGQIGVWPTPDGAYTLYFSGDVKPVVPTADSDTSVWFDEAEELIEAAACKRVCLKYLRDSERAMTFVAAEKDAEASFHSEYVRKSTSGKVRVHD
mgnify:CR=1 FL=1